MLIGTIKELKDELYGYISDASKDAQGFRTRYDISDMTIEQLMVEADYWTGRVIEAIEEDKIREAENKADFEAAIAATIEAGAADRATAVRWMYDAYCEAENWDMGLDHWFWSMGLGYSDSHTYEQEFRSVVNHRDPRDMAAAEKFCDETPYFL